MKPCQFKLEVRDSFDVWKVPTHNSKVRDFTGDSVFQQTADDNKVGFSVEDRQFLTLMDREMKKVEEGFWTAPLPFKHVRPRAPNNRI
jgi:hypothetical protein